MQLYYRHVALFIPCQENVLRIFEAKLLEISGILVVQYFPTK